MRLMLMLFCLLLVVGCTTTQQPTALNNLQIKVAQLEQKIDERDQGISDLKYEVKGLSSQLENAQAPSQARDTYEAQSGSSLDLSQTDSAEIIRVPVSAEQVQKALKNAGYYHGTIDGKIGANSKKAIAEFQKEHSLKSDGIIGKRTWAELKSYLD